MDENLSRHDFRLVFDSAADYAAATEHLRAQGVVVDLVEPDELEMIVTVEAPDYKKANWQLSDLLPKGIDCAFC
jgi:hypothetical protein